jgi:hypothetical protein
MFGAVPAEPPDARRWNIPTEHFDPHLARRRAGMSTSVRLKSAKMKPLERMTRGEAWGRS